MKLSLISRSRRLRQWSISPEQMHQSNQQLIHTFGALADLGQEVANTGDFNDMVQTSMHLLLGTLALRRGAVVECGAGDSLDCVAVWGLEKSSLQALRICEEEKASLVDTNLRSLLLKNGSENGFVSRYRETLVASGIELIIPMVVRSQLTGFVLLGQKATGADFTAEDFETIRAMTRHIGVGIHTHRLLEQVAQRADENRRLYEELRAIYRDTVRAFAAAIDIKDKYTQGHSEASGSTARSLRARWVGAKTKLKAFKSPVTCTT